MSIDPSVSRARNHHFVPQFYLKNFARPRSKDGSLCVFDLEERKRFSTKPRNVAAMRDYNRIDLDGIDPNIVESRLSLHESEADQAFRRIITARSIDNRQDFAFVIALIAQIAVNNPLFRKQRNDIMSQLATVMMQNMVATEERWDTVTARAAADGCAFADPASYEEMRDAVVNKLIVPRATKETLIEQEMALWPKMMHILEARKWTLIVAAAGAGEFATSDRPFSLRWNNEAMNRGPYGVGLGCSDTTLTFPLSKDLALIGTFESGGGTSIARSEIVAAMNLTTLAAAMRQVYAPSDFLICDHDREIRPFSESAIWRQIRERPTDIVGTD